MKFVHINLLGREFGKDAIESLLINELAAVRYRDAYLINYSEGEAWVFEYGILVTWNLREDQRQRLIRKLTNVIESPLGSVNDEEYAYEIGSGNNLIVRDDMLVLPDDEPLTRLAVSHAFAQETQLEFFEEQTKELIQANLHISKTLAKTGKVPMSRKELSKIRGQLFDTSTDITWQFSLLDTPEFFWSYPEYEPTYRYMLRYLDVEARLAILNTKLNTIHELLDMLAGELHHKHSTFLEWIVIILIASEIVLFFFPGH